MAGKVILFAALSIQLTVGETVWKPKPPPEKCDGPMGLKNGLVGADQLSASSEFGPQYATDQVRLNMKAGVGAWCAKTNDQNQFIQVDFRSPKTLTGIVTQGREEAAQWVTSYALQFSNDGQTWNPVLNDAKANQVFSGNFDQNTHVTHRFARSIRARFVRVLPLTWSGHISMRMELLGCRFSGAIADLAWAVEKCNEPMGLEDGSIGPDQLSALSEFDTNYGTDRARLNLKAGVGAWCAKSNDKNQFIQVDFRSPKTLTGIVTQGRDKVAQWVSSYSIQFSNDPVRTECGRDMGPT